MGIQILITGDHSTDVLAELNSLATALLGKPVAGQFFLHTSPPDTESPIGEPVPDTDIGTPVGESIEVEGPKDAIGEATSTKPKRSRVKKVDKTMSDITPDQSVGIEEELIVTGPEKVSIDDIKEPKKELVITRELIRDTMVKVGKGADGVDIPANYAKIRSIFRGLIPAGKEIKVINIPDEKLSQAYYEIAAI